MGWWQIASPSGCIDRDSRGRDTGLVNGDGPADVIGEWLGEVRAGLCGHGIAPVRDLVEDLWSGEVPASLPGPLGEDLSARTTRARGRVESLYRQEWDRPPHEKEWYAALNFVVNGAVTAGQVSEAKGVTRLLDLLGADYIPLAVGFFADDGEDALQEALRMPDDGFRQALLAHQLLEWYAGCEEDNDEAVWAFAQELRDMTWDEVEDFARHAGRAINERLDWWPLWPLAAEEGEGVRDSLRTCRCFPGGWWSPGPGTATGP